MNSDKLFKLLETYLVESPWTQQQHVHSDGYSHVYSLRAPGEKWEHVVKLHFEDHNKSMHLEVDGAFFDPSLPQHLVHPLIPAIRDVILRHHKEHPSSFPYSFHATNNFDDYGAAENKKHEIFHRVLARELASHGFKLEKKGIYTSVIPPSLSESIEFDNKDPYDGEVDTWGNIYHHHTFPSGHRLRVYFTKEYSHLNDYKIDFSIAAPGSDIHRFSRGGIDPKTGSMVYHHLGKVIQAFTDKYQPASIIGGGATDVDIKLSNRKQHLYSGALKRLARMGGHYDASREKIYYPAGSRQKNLWPTELTATENHPQVQRQRALFPAQDEPEATENHPQVQRQRALFPAQDEPEDNRPDRKQSYLPNLFTRR